MRRAPIWLLVLAPFGCSPPGPRNEPPPPQGTAGPIVEGHVGNWDWLRNEEPNIGAYGYVLFGRKPPSPEQELGFRALRTCEALMNVLHQATPGASGEYFFTTFWPLDGTAPKDPPCAKAVEHYDFDRVASLVACLKVGGKPGPILVAQAEPQRGQVELRRLVLDLSSAPAIGVEADTLRTGVERWVSFTRSEPGTGWLAAVTDNTAHSLATWLTSGSIQVGTVSKLERCR